MKVHRHPDLIRAAARLVLAHPKWSANRIAAELCCRRADGLAVVKAVRALSRLPGEPLEWFLFRESDEDDDLRVLSPEQFVADLYAEAGSS